MTSQQHRRCAFVDAAGDLVASGYRGHRGALCLLKQGRHADAATRKDDNRRVDGQPVRYGSSRFEARFNGPKDHVDVSLRDDQGRRQDHVRP